MKVLDWILIDNLMLKIGRKICSLLLTRSHLFKMMRYEQVIRLFLLRCTEIIYLLLFEVFIYYFQCIINAMQCILYIRTILLYYFLTIMKIWHRPKYKISHDRIWSYLVDDHLHYHLWLFWTAGYWASYYFFPPRDWSLPIEMWPNST